MSSGYVIPVDPVELANRFASTEKLLDDDERDTEMNVLFSQYDYEDVIRPLLDLIPKREADLIDLYYFCRKRQADIATIFDVTQAAISYRLDRGVQRLKFLISIPKVTEEEMSEDLSEIFGTIDVSILINMWKTTCQSEVANKLQLTQGRVRHRFFKAVEILKREANKSEKYRPYEKIFSSIADKNFNILKAVKLPQWGGRGVDRCL